MRTSRIVIVLVAVAAAACLSYLPYLNSGPSEASDTVPAEAATDTGISSGQVSLPVSANPSADLADGFRGAVHPLLHGRTRLEVDAHWTSIGKGRDKLDENVPPQVYAVFQKLTPARSAEIYSERDLSGLLPDKLESVGQMWALDPDKVASILKQFHPNASMHVRAKGRRAGPDGAFGVIRAMSANYLDIAYRIHAEFEVTPKEFRRHILPVTLWYTPAYFTGRMIVNRKTGTVDYFRLAIPTDKTLNVHLTVFLAPYGEHHDIVRVEQMELVGGDSNLLTQNNWERAIELAEASAKLTHQFYKFNDIAWVSADKALAVAQERNKPILAMVMWGALDDQSC